MLSNVFDSDITLTIENITNLKSNIIIATSLLGDNVAMWWSLSDVVVFGEVWIGDKMVSLLWYYIYHSPYSQILKNARIAEDWRMLAEAEMTEKVWFNVEISSKKMNGMGAGIKDVQRMWISFLAKAEKHFI